MNIFDIAIILLIIASGFVGIERGIIKEGVMLAGTLVVYFLAFLLKGPIGLLLCKLLPFYGFNGLVTLNIIIYQLLAFFIVALILFSIYNIVLKCTGVVQKLVDLSVILTIPSKILGFIVGIIEGYIVIFILLLVLSVPLRNVDYFTNSKGVDIVMNHSPILSSSFEGVSTTLEDLENITHRVVSGDTNISQINMDIVKDLIDCNIISKEDTLDIIETGKLSEVVGLEDFVKNYDHE